MKFALHRIIDFAFTQPSEIDRALTEFFGAPPIKPFADENIEPLFLEWLIYEYKPTSGPVMMVSYILRNPDRLPEREIDQFKHIIQTQRYSDFEILGFVPGSHIILEDVFTGEKYDVFDKIGSINAQSKGILKARIARVDEKWYLVGANPIFIPMTYTPRMKKILKRNKKVHGVSIRDTADMLIERENHPPEPPKIMTGEELVAKRKELEDAYNKACVKHKASLVFADLLNDIYEEQRVNVLDFWKKLTKKGLNEDFFMNELQLLQDIWNHFPHKDLGGISPSEMYAKLSKESKRSSTG